MSKRFIKQTAAAVLLTTSVLSFSPVALGASTSVDQSVSNVKTELSKVSTHYVYPSLEGKLVPSSALYATLNSAKKNYQSTRSAVVSSKLSAAQKEVKLKEIDTLYNEQVSGGLVPYIDAYNYATEYLVPIMNELKAAEAKNDFAAVETAYHKLSFQLKDRTSILYRFSGKAARDLLLDQYKKPADAKLNELKVPVTIYMKAVQINDLLAAGKKEEAKKAYADIDALLVRLPNASTNKFVAALKEEVAKVKKAVDGLSPQQALDLQVSSLVTTLNASQGDKVTASTVASNSLVVTIKEDESIAEFMGKGFYQTFTKQLKVTKVNGFDPTSAEAVEFLAKAFPTGAEKLSDLKGKTLTIPLTVNNGSAFDVTFTVSFN